jgi:hypothetical protein
MYGGFNDLLWQLRSFSGEDYSQLQGLLRHSNQPSLERIQNRVRRAAYFSGAKEVAGIKVSNKLAVQAEMFADLDEKPGIPEQDLRPLRDLPEEAWSYLTGPERNLDEITIRFFEYGFHPRNRRIVVPMRDCKGKLVNISGRTILRGVQPKWLHAKGFRRDLYLYGEDKIVKDYPVCYLVEGMFDVAGLWKHGYVNCLATLGAYISDFQVEKLVRWFDEVVIVRDGDDAGKQGVYGSERTTAHGVKKISGTLQKLSARLRKGARVVDPPDGVDPDELALPFLIEHLGPPQRSS